MTQNIKQALKDGSIKKPKLLIIGHGRHGKDSLAQIFHDEYGLTFTSSSEAAAKLFLFDKLKGKYGYKTFQECYEDRHNRREEWFTEISEFNKTDKAKLAKAIMAKNDIYVGMRSEEEIKACLREKIFDIIIWIERKSEPLEPLNSFQITKSSSHCVIRNDREVADLKQKVDAFMLMWYSAQNFLKHAELV